MRVVPPAISLPHYLFDGLPGHNTPMPVVRCFHWYVPISAGRRGHFWLTPPIVLGIAFTCLAAKPKSANAFPMYLGDSYYSVSLSLSVILTLMIIVRLILHRRNVRKAIGVADSAGGLYTAVITMLVESYALYFVTFILFFAYWATGNWASELFAGVLSATQVRAFPPPFSRPEI